MSTFPDSGALVVADLNVLSNYARQYEDPAEFLSQLALLTSLESDAAMQAERDTERVTLSSVHQAKGLEWKVVFVIGLNEGSFPSHRSIESPAAVEEERRLFYVAVTRACDELYLTYPLMRATASFDERWQEPSRFISNFPRGMVNEWKIKAAPPAWE